MHGWIDKYIRAEVMYGLSDKCSYIRPEVVYENTSRTTVWLNRCDCENICIRVELLFGLNDEKMKNDVLRSKRHNTCKYFSEHR